MLFDLHKRDGQPIQEIPCGQCIGCRLDRSAAWALRCVHESQQHSENCFVTLTYNDDNLPPDGQLNKKHFQDFMKRLRKKMQPNKIRYFHCGEYGTDFKRPHYHACLFGVDFADKELLGEKDGIKLYYSYSLEKLWQNGYVTLGEVTFESAQYTARYILKKSLGYSATVRDPKTDLLPSETIQPYTGEIIPFLQEYTTMSLRPGIGADWFSKYKTDVYPFNFVIHSGIKMKPPRYYQNLYEIDNAPMLKVVKKKSRQAAQRHAADNTPERREARLICKTAEVNQNAHRAYEA